MFYLLLFKKPLKKAGVPSYEELQKTTKLTPLDSPLFAPVEVLIKGLPSFPPPPPRLRLNSVLFQRSVTESPKKS